MNRSISVVLAAAAIFISTGCMSVRDRVALRLGLSTKNVKNQYLAYERQEMLYGTPAPGSPEPSYLALAKAARPIDHYFVAPPAKPAIPASRFEAFEPERAYTASAAAPKGWVAYQAVVSSPVYPELVKEDPRAKAVEAKNGLTRYALEQEAGRLRWEAVVLHKQADDLRKDVLAMDLRWAEMREHMVAVDAERHRMREVMAKIDTQLERTKARADEVEAEWTRLASASPAGRVSPYRR